MNILFLRPQLEIGGASQNMFMLGSGLARRGHRVIVASGGGSWQKRFIEAGLPVYRVSAHPSSIINLFKLSREIVQIARSERVDLIHSHHRFTTLVARLTAPFTDLPVVSTVHELKYNRQWLARLWLGQHIVVASSATRDYLIREFGLAAKRITAVPLAIALDRLPAADTIATTRRAWGLDNNRPRLGCVARLSPEKGVAVSLQALPLVLKKCPDLRCLLIGDGPLSGELRNLAAGLGLTKVVTWVGAVETALPYMANLDLIVVPSLSEGFGLVALEAMALAKPVVASNVGGLPELVVDGATGLLVPPGDPQALAEAILALLQDPQRARQMGQVGRERLVTEFSPERVVKSTEEVYRKAV